ncbi:hypothetical protein [Circovirus-like genome DCCV-2]|uniref:Uncharacterized protein n=1 Tax=Circovirus-like genome DCCV-2 TaxID=1788442 RepID=A0A190WHA1_9VIRU|nr:hypothetical protein [Circovirus-like genome DCCV-2]AMB42954.1 hypothetical protein [Circovirus-like genome DCCV-2]
MLKISALPIVMLNNNPGSLGYPGIKNHCSVTLSPLETESLVWCLANNTRMEVPISTPGFNFLERGIYEPPTSSTGRGAIQTSRLLITCGRGKPISAKTATIRRNRLRRLRRVTYLCCATAWKNTSGSTIA